MESDIALAKSACNDYKSACSWGALSALLTMPMEIVRNQTPEERELEKKQAEFAALEAELIQRELDLATLRAELAEFESRYLRTVGVLYAELDEIEAQIAEAQARRKPSRFRGAGTGHRARAQAQESAKPPRTVAVPKPKPTESLKKTISGSRKAHPPRFGHKRRRSSTARKTHGGG